MTALPFTRPRSPWGVLLLACGTGLLAGCGCDPTATVSGTITVAGKPSGVDGLTINFVGVAGQTVVASVAADGTYRAENVPVGEVQVGFAYVSTKDAEKKEKDGARPETDPKKSRAKPKDVKAKPLFPERYKDPRTSGVTTTVEAGKENTFSHDLR